MISLCLYLWQLLAFFLSIFLKSFTFQMLALLSFIPIVSATSNTSPFPDISFSTFSSFIQSNFNNNISLSSTLVILFSLLENPDLLNLHFQRKIRISGTEWTSSVWIDALARLLICRFDDDTSLLLNSHATPEKFGDILHQLAVNLKLKPSFQQRGHMSSLKPINTAAIEPVYVIAPTIFQCQTPTCRLRSLHFYMKHDDVAQVNLIKSSTYHPYSYVVGARCGHGTGAGCKTTYLPDTRYWSTPDTDHKEELLQPDARYLKIGQSLGSDHVFSSALCNATYNLHASSSAYKEFWNDSFSSENPNNLVSRRHIWQAFIQESTRLISSDTSVDLTIPYNSSIDSLTKHAFQQLGQKGQLPNMTTHSCSDCTQPYRESVDDEPDISSEDTVNMRVVDGIVTGPVHCARPGCTSALANYRGESYCHDHVAQYGALCRMADCSQQVVQGTKAC